MVHRPGHAVGDPRVIGDPVFTRARRVGNLHRHQRAVPADASHALVVVGLGRSDAGTVGAVRVPGVVGITAIGIAGDGRVMGHYLAVQVFVIQLRPLIHDGDHDVWAAGADVPGCLGINVGVQGAHPIWWIGPRVLHTPLLGVMGVIGRDGFL